MRWLITAADSLLSFFYPPKCSLCDVLIDDERHLCVPCGHSLHKLDGDFVPHRREKVWFARARSCFAYEGKIVDAIHGLKYNRRFDLLAFFADALRGELDRCENVDLLLPVPLHRKRLASRGFNQSALLAQKLAKRVNLPVDLFSLQKIRNDPPQIEKNADERLQNVRGSFAVKSASLERLSGKQLLLIDDVLTTGATANECARVLRKAGAERVDVLTIARPL